MNDEATYTLRLAKPDFGFSCAHFIVFGADRAELLHGHNYRVSVEIRGRALDEEGLLIDLGEVKSMLRRACRRLDGRTLVPSGNRHLGVTARDGGVEVVFGERRYRFPAEDVLLLSETNTSIEILARMLWRELAAALRGPRIDELVVSVSQTRGQECSFRASVRE